VEAFKQGDFQGALDGFSAALKLGEVRAMSFAWLVVDRST
jgi:hypothetical protein